MDSESKLFSQELCSSKAIRLGFTSPITNLIDYKHVSNIIFSLVLFAIVFSILFKASNPSWGKDDWKKALGISIPVYYLSSIVIYFILRFIICKYL